MHRSLPPIGLLRAFEACARHLSVSRAAEELCLTQGAVSRQIAQLEASLGLKLFHRVRRRLLPTSVGTTYALEIRASLSRIEAATLALQANQGAGGTLTISVSPTFGTRWLVPRMRSFQTMHPKVVVNLVNYTARPAPIDFAAEHVDAAIFFGDSVWPGVTGHRLLAEERIPVCSPRLLEDGRLHAIEDIASEILLQHTTRPRAWHEWLQAAGISHIDGLRGPKFQHMAMVTEAAVAGLGIGLLARFFVAEEIASGRLVVPFDTMVRSEESYFLAYPDGARDFPALRAFREWLLRQVASGV
jgi:LysR family glycine cleavage system transcriptional activator